MKKQLNIKESDEKIFRQEGGETMGSILRVVRYVVNEKPGEKLLEKRITFGKKTGKRAGFTKEDFEFIVENKEKILEAMK